MLPILQQLINHHVSKQSDSYVDADNPVRLLSLQQVANEKLFISTNPKFGTNDSSLFAKLLPLIMPKPSELKAVSLTLRPLNMTPITVQPTLLPPPALMPPSVPLTKAEIKALTQTPGPRQKSTTGVPVTNRKHSAEYVDRCMTALLEREESKGNYWISLASARKVIDASAKKQAFREEKYKLCGDDKVLLDFFTGVAAHLNTTPLDLPISTPEGVKQQDNRRVNKTLRVQVWVNYNSLDQMNANCYTCNREVSFISFVVGHVKSRRDGGETELANLRPICETCNLSMGPRHMFEFTISHGLQGRIRTEF